MAATFSISDTTASLLPLPGAEEMRCGIVMSTIFEISSESPWTLVSMHVPVTGGTNIASPVGSQVAGKIHQVAQQACHTLALEHSRYAAQEPKCQLKRPPETSVQEALGRLCEFFDNGLAGFGLPRIGIE